MRKPKKGSGAKLKSPKNPPEPNLFPAPSLGKAKKSKPKMKMKKRSY